MLNELLSEYVDLFNENFPIFMMRGTPEDELITILKKCIEEKKPYQLPDDIPDALY